MNMIVLAFSKNNDDQFLNKDGIIYQWNRTGVCSTREHLDNHPRLSEIQIKLIMDVRGRADLDYIAGKRSILFGDYSSYYWNMAQAIEKYLKVACVLNGVVPSSNKSGHDIEAIFEQFKLFIDPLLTPKNPTVRDASGKNVSLLAHIAECGSPAHRYYKSTYYVDENDKVENFIFHLRRASFLPLDYSISFSEGVMSYGDYLLKNPQRVLELEIGERDKQLFSAPRSMHLFVTTSLEPTPKWMRVVNQHSWSHSTYDIHIRYPLELCIRNNAKTSDGYEASKLGKWVKKNISTHHGYDLTNILRKYNAMPKAKQK